MHFYTNSIETQYADEVIWRTYSDDEVPFEEGGEQLSQVLIVFDDKQIVLSGFVDMYRGLNGSYQIETTSPESWEISVIE